MKIAAAVATVACGLVLAGCGSSGDDTAPAARPSVVASTPTSAVASSPAAIPSPSDEQRVALVTKLQQVDAGLVADVDDAVTYARNLCQYVTNGDVAGAQNYAVSAAAADGVTISSEQGAQVVAAVQGTFCS